ncbi:MAG: hypothetical protein ACAI25_18595 [Planctomycetota bacterium]
MKRTSAAAVLTCLIVTAGCVHSPIRSAEMEGQLRWLDLHGYDDGAVDKPKTPAIALILDILPIPGVGHYYVGDIKDGLKTSLLFWLIVPWIKGPIDAYKEASYMNDVAYIEYAKDHGWFDKPEGPNGRPGPGAVTKDETPPPSAKQPASAPPREDRPAPAAPSNPPPQQQPPTQPPANGGGHYEQARPNQFCAECGSKFEGNFCAACGAKRR